MAGPFFQGSVKDLMSVAGPWTGGQILGEQMRTGQDMAESELQKSILERTIREQEAKQNAEMHPLKLQQLQQQIAELQAKNDTFNEMGGAKGAAGRGLEDHTVKIQKMKMDALESVRKFILETPWSPELQENLPKMFEGAPPAIANGFKTHAATAEAWAKFQREQITGSKEYMIKQQEIAGQAAIHKYDTDKRLEGTKYAADKGMEGRIQAAEMRARMTAQVRTHEANSANLANEARELAEKAERTTNPDQKAELARQAQAKMRAAQAEHLNAQALRSAAQQGGLTLDPASGAITPRAAQPFNPGWGGGGGDWQGGAPPQGVTPPLDPTKVRRVN